MKYRSFYLCILLIFKFNVALSATYNMTELVATPLDVPDIVNTIVWDNTDTNYPDDDDKLLVNIGFPFQFAETTYTELTIFTNGILKFGNDENMHRDYRNEALDTNEGDRFIAVYWDDVEEAVGSSVTYGMSGAAPNRKFIVNWENVKAFSSTLRYDFQVVLYENGDVRYRYDNNTANGESATIGIEVDDNDFVQYSYNQVSVEVSFDLLFRNLLLTLPTPIAQYRLDEISWDGSIDGVKDSSLNTLHGQSFLGANTSDTTPALGSTIGTCNYGEFDGSNGYVEIADNNLLDFANEFSVGAWVKIDSLPSSGLKTIVSKDENYEFHVNPSGQINWWWRTSVSNDIKSFNSTTSIAAGVWAHIVISYAVGSQKIFINGIESGSTSYNENLANNSDPVQIGADQNSATRYFNGSIDEVNIFDDNLSRNQVLELMEKTRPCSSINLCVSSFPDGLNSHNNGIITFGRDAQLFFSPDDVLDADSIVLDGASNDRSCVSVECQANGLASDITTPPSFPITSGSSNNITIGNNSAGASDPSINNYNQIDIGNGSVFTISSSYSDYYIDILAVGNNTVLELLPGNYWIRNLDTGATNNPNSGLEIKVIGAGTARLYINDDVILGQSLLANSPSQANQGDPSQLMLYSYSNIIIERDSTFSGIIYAAGDVDIQRDGNVYGAIAGDNISLGRLTNVFYDPNATVSLDFGNLCQGASCTLGSFNIAQPSYALACPGTRTQIGIQAMCDDGTSVKDDYIGTVDLTSSENTLSQFYTSLAASAPTSTLDFDGSESGIKQAYLFHQNENPALQVIATDAAVPVSTTSVNTTDFRTAGFAITNPASFTCGSSTTMDITAIGEDSTGVSCQVLTGFTGSKGLKAWYSVNIDGFAGADPVTTGLSFASQLITDETEPTLNNVNVTFTNGVANVAIAYGNAGQILAVNVKHDDSPYDGAAPELANADLTGSSDVPFVARPEKITLSTTVANSSCASADENCLKFVAAGEPFIMKAEAQCMGGSLADDYQGELTFSHSLVAPLLAGGSSGLLSVTSGTVLAVDAGAIQFDQAISEVGVFNLTAEAADYFGSAVTAFTLPNVGRFYPNHFTMIDPATANSCGDFSYMGQPGIGINYTLQAHKLGGGVTLNYGGGFAKALPASHINLVAENSNDGGGYQDRLSDFIDSGWANGEYLYADSGSFSRAPLGFVDDPYRDLQVGIQFTDNDDNVSALMGLDMRADANTDCSALGDCNAKLIGSLELRFGQLKLSNAFGPETFALDMVVRTEYFDGTDFILNTNDNCTIVSEVEPLLSPTASWTGNLAAGETTPSLAVNIINGVTQFSFSAAGLGNEGSVIFEYDTSTSISPVTDLPWLNTENDGDGDYADNPKGKITFGQFRGNDRMIYWREVVR
ncbi:MAG: LamG domain-containing protein [Oleispira sp.]